MERNRFFSKIFEGSEISLFLVLKFYDCEFKKNSRLSLEFIKVAFRSW
jgi:hypothetical protein